MAVEAQTDLIREYETRTPRSRELFERFRAHLPGGETRTLTYYEPYPVVIERGEGPTLVVDSPDPAALHLALLVEGVCAAPRGMLNLSTAMAEEDLETVAGAYARATARLG